MGRFVTRSPLPAERALQSWGLAVLGWLVLSALVVGGVLVVEDLDQPSAGESRPVGHETLRAVLGAVQVLLCLVHPVLVRRHLDAVRSTRGLKARYRNAALGVALVSGLWFFFFWYGGLLAAVLLLVVAVWVSTIDVLPHEAMTETVRTAPLDAWREEEITTWGRWQVGHPELSVLTILLVPPLLVAAIIGVGLLLV